MDEYYNTQYNLYVPQVLDDVGWVAGRAYILQKNDVVLAWLLERGADLHIVHMVPPPPSVISVKSTLFLPFWYQLIQTVPEKGLLNVCCCYGCKYKLCTIQS